MPRGSRYPVTQRRCQRRSEQQISQTGGETKSYKFTGASDLTLVASWAVDPEASGSAQQLEIILLLFDKDGNRLLDGTVDADFPHYDFASLHYQGLQAYVRVQMDLAPAAVNYVAVVVSAGVGETMRLVDSVRILSLIHI